MEAVIRKLVLVIAGSMLIAGCGEDLTAPGVCPQFCPPSGIDVVDTVMASAIARDSTYRGYVSSSYASEMEIIGAPGGVGVGASRGVVRFPAFPDSVYASPGDTVATPIAATDSFRVTLHLRRRRVPASGVTIALYRLPVAIDSTATYAALDPFFQDSARIGEIIVPDTLVGPDSVTGTDSIGVTLPTAAFPTFAADGERASIGIAVVAPDSAWVGLGTVESGTGALLSGYIKADSAGTLVKRTVGRSPSSDFFVLQTTTPAASGELTVGGVPSARTLLRIDLPSSVVDSSQVARATLLITPSQPVLGAVGDSVGVIAYGLTTDIGPKSPLIVVSSDSVVLLTAYIHVGATDTLHVDVTSILRQWRAIPGLPHAIVLTAIPEGATSAELRFGDATSSGVRLELTYLPPYRFRG